MTKLRLRPVAICVMFASGTPLLAPQGLSAQTVATVNQASFGTVEGKALDGSGKALKNTTIPVKNNRRPLKVEAFNTSVQKVEATSKGRDTRVTIRTKDAERPTHKERIEAAAGGFQLLLIELAK